MIEKLDLKIRQMHAALGSLASDDLSKVTVGTRQSEGVMYCSIDFGLISTPAELANIAELTVHNIACLKDHLKVWVKSNGVALDVEAFVNSNQDVALLTDLWNVHKHMQLDRKPRSGHTPSVVDLKRSLSFTTAGAPDSYVRVDLDPATGKMVIDASPGSSADLVITGDIVNERGARLGDFAEVCENACIAWEKAFALAGVPIPLRESITQRPNGITVRAR